VPRLRRPLRRLRLRDETVPLRGALEEQIEPGLQDLLFRRARVRVRERVARSLELLLETLRNGEMHAEQVASERLERVPGGPDSWGVHGPCGHFGIEEKLRHRFVLAAEEIGEAGREVACVHERSFARDFSSS
jgi:hypothetical protein